MQQVLATKLIIVCLVSLQNLAGIFAQARANQICLEDDYTNDLPIFIEKKSICNYDTVPIPVYSIRTSPKYDDAKFCLKGELSSSLCWLILPTQSHYLHDLILMNDC